MILKIGVSLPSDKMITRDDVWAWRIWDNVDDITYRWVDLNELGGKQYCEAEIALVAEPSSGTSEEGNKEVVYEWKKPDDRAVLATIKRFNPDGIHQSIVIIYQGCGYILNDNGQTIEKIS